MDLQDFDSSALYFDEVLPVGVARLLTRAAQHYPHAVAEAALLKAWQQAPDNLSVLVGLYRFYYYQRRYQDALGIAARVMSCVAPQLGLPALWRDIRTQHLAGAARNGIALLRFYLLALKGAGYLCLRLDLFEQGKAMLAKVVELDEENRLGAQLLLDVLAANDAKVLPFPTRISMEVSS